MNNLLPNYLTRKSLFLGVAGLGLIALMANDAKAAPSLYFDVNGASAGSGVANGGSYSWDNTVWSTSSGLAVATGNWVAGDFARFTTAGVSYTVTDNNAESMAGLFVTSGTENLTVNSAGSGSLSIISGDQGFLVQSGGSLVLNTVVSGPGGLAPEWNGGTSGGGITINGINTYSGGTTFGYSSEGLVFFNNNSSFGTGDIRQILAGAVAPLLNNSGTTVTLANNLVNTVAGGGFNFASSPNSPVIVNGNVNAGANATLIKNNGNSTASLSLNGNINSTGTLTLAGNNGGTMKLGGANTGLTGNVVIGGGAGANAIIVKLTTANTLAAAANVNFVGGGMDFGGLNHSMGITTLGLGAAATSTLDFEGGSTAAFANSSSLSWTSGGILDLLNYDNGLYVGTDATGLTAGQLADIEFNGTDLGNAQILSNGEIVDAPEPSTIALGLLGGLGMLWSVRRRKA